ncbi:hypothetical protein GGR53DRAFT_209846 [Hypoxylon sp. FL1150]|nr:hypothetical protein GGR53DRAFT_209846 [Hypoxylon sp. FL1150]
MTTWHDYVIHNPGERSKCRTDKEIKISSRPRYYLGLFRSLYQREGMPAASREFLLEAGKSIFMKQPSNEPSPPNIQVNNGILWVYHYKWDHVRAWCAPKPSNRPLIIDSLTYLLRSYTVIGKVSIQGDLDDGHKNPVSSIEVIFKEMTSEVTGITVIYHYGNSSTIGIRGREP